VEEAGEGPSLPLGWYQCTLHHGSEARCAVETLREGCGVEPLVSANRNKSISFPSDAAEPQCVLVKELQLGRRPAERRECCYRHQSFRIPASGTAPVLIAPDRCTRARKTGQVADYGRLRGPVYILQNELSIRERWAFPPPDAGTAVGESPPKNQPRPTHELPDPMGQLCRR
jgi:hypothetical protein